MPSPRNKGGKGLSISAAVAGLGVIHLFEDWLRPALDTGALVPVLEPWWQSFSGPFLYFASRRLMPAPLCAFVDFIKTSGARGAALGRLPRFGANRRLGC